MSTFNPTYDGSLIIDAFCYYRLFPTMPKYKCIKRGNRDRDRMVTTTYATNDVVSSNLDQGEVYNIMW
jgi:hypothetical protein